MQDDNGNPIESTEELFEGAWDSEAIQAAWQKLLEYDANQTFVVDKIFPAGAMHLLGGPSGAGKTTWLFQMLYEWEQKKKLFGEYQSNPCPWVYISSDRSMRETAQTLKRIGLLHWRFEAYSLEDLLAVNKTTKHLDSPDLIKHVIGNEKFKHAELFVIEGLQALMPNVPKGQSQNKAELVWAMQSRRILSPTNKTIIATTHNPKQTSGPGQSSSDERSKFLGSQGFIGSCSTMIGFEKDEKDKDLRKVVIMGRNFKDILQTYRLDENGKFVLELSNGEDMNPEETEELQFAIWLREQPGGSATRKDAWDYFVRHGMGSERKFKAVLTKLRNDGVIASEGKGVKGSTITYQPQTIQ